MKIAVYVNDQENIASFQETGAVRLYEGTVGHWLLKREIAFSIRQARSLTEIKQTLHALAPQLDGCKTFLTAEVRGLIYAVLQEEMGFHTWKSQGSLFEQLDIVAEKDLDLLAHEEQERLIAAAKPKVPVRGCEGGGGGGGCRHGHQPLEPAPKADLDLSPLRVSEGHYRVNLVKALQADPGLNSRQILIPILENAPFQTLEILCDHLPKWFPQKIEDLHLTAQLERFDGVTQGVKAIVSKAHPATPSPQSGQRP